jgi:hypothetical protein
MGTDHPLSDREGLGAEARLNYPYEPPALVVIGPVTAFTFGSKSKKNDVGGTKTLEK